MTALDDYDTHYPPPGADDFSQDDLDEILSRLRTMSRHTEHLTASVHQLARLLNRRAVNDALPTEQKSRVPSVRKTMSTPQQALAFLRGAAAARFCGPSHFRLWAAQERLAGRLE